MRRSLLAALLLVLPLLLPTTVQGQPDSVRAETLRNMGLPETHTPRGALWRASALPGWGQVYNRQYWKLPIVYIGLGTLTYLAIENHNDYQLFRRAGRFASGLEQDQTDDNPFTPPWGGNPFERYEAEYNEALARFGQDQVDFGTIRDQRDAFRRQRNLLIIGTGVFYALTVVEAYVSAHLLTFDVGEELSFRVAPSPGGGAVPALRLRF